MAYYGSGQSNGPHMGGSGRQSRPTAPAPAGARNHSHSQSQSQYDFDPDELDSQLQYARPEPIGFQPPGGYHVRREPRDMYQDDYRRRDEPDYRRYRGDRGYFEPPRHGSFNTSSRGYGGGPPSVSSAYRKQEYMEYLHELRVRDPIGYRKWYEEYKANPQKPPPQLPGYNQPGGGLGNYQNYATLPRVGSSASHYDSKRPGSGRSSITDEPFYKPAHFQGGSNAPSVTTEHQSLPYDPYNYNNHFIPIQHQQDDISFNETTPERMTPQKFLEPHRIVRFTPLGQLISVKCGVTTLEIHSLRPMLAHLAEYQKIEQFPGPLVRGKVHKHTVIQFCQKKIKEAKSREDQLDRDNFVLLWEFLVLLLRQNGSIVGSDIAELLVKREVGEAAVVNKEEQQNGEVDNSESQTQAGRTNPRQRHTSDSQNRKMFSDYLLFGHTKDALEFAMKNNLWGHALILGFKMGEKEYKNVMSRFVSEMSSNDPLVTLYEVMGGKIPPSLINYSEESFGDWKPHLAMILSNSGWKPDFENKSIVALGDTLGAKNHSYGSQFCYLMSNMDFSSNSKLGPLLGLTPDHSNVVDATQMTEIYEFARSLADPHYSLGSTFLQYKFDYAKILVDFGFSREAYLYCEEMGKHVFQHGQTMADTLKWSTLQLAERLKFFDESSEEEPSWLLELKQALGVEEHEQELNNHAENHQLDLPPNPSETEGQKQFQSNDVVHTDTYIPQVETNGLLHPEPTVNVVQPVWNMEQTTTINQPKMKKKVRFEDDDLECEEDESGDEKYFPKVALSKTEHRSIPLVPFAPSHIGQGLALVSNDPVPDPDGPDPDKYEKYESIIATNPVQFKSTFPIDQPFDKLPNLKSSKTALFRSKTYPIDTQCCDVQQPCDEHDSLQNWSGDSRMQLPINAGPNLKGAEKNNMPVPMADMSNVQPQYPSYSQPQYPSAPEQNSNQGTMYPNYPPVPEQNPMQGQGGVPYPQFTPGSTAQNQMQQQPMGSYNQYQPEPSQNQMSQGPYMPNQMATPQTNGQPMPSMQKHSSDSKLPNTPSSGNKNDSTAASKNKTESKENKDAPSSSWIGKLIPKFIQPKNQMKLPDDKDPPIVWDEAKKQWVNKHGDSDGDSAPKGPPPSDFDLTKNINNNNNNYAPPPRTNSVPNFQHQNSNINPMPFNNPNIRTDLVENASYASHNQNQAPVTTEPTAQSAQLSQIQQSQQGANKYKLPKGRTLRSSYVDVFNPGSGTTISGSGPNPVKNGPQPFIPPMFIPGPAPPESMTEQSSFFTPGGFQQQQQQHENQGPLPQ